MCFRPFFHAYEKEETLFVRSDFLKAIARLDYTPCLPRLKERLGQLRAAIPEAETGSICGRNSWLFRR